MRIKKKFERMSRYYDICIIGGGILGSSIAKNCAKKFKNARIGLLEAEDRLFGHNSSRNSGVLHTGIYYTPGTLKAKFSVEGVQAMKSYCAENSIDVNNCGKLIVPVTSEENALVENLYKNGIANGTDCELVDANGAREIEPLVKISGEFEHALYCKDAAVTSLGDILGSLKSELDEFDNLEVNSNTRFVKKLNQYIDTDEILTNQGKIEAKIVINTAGHDALRIAKQFGVGTGLSQMHLKGYYLKAMKADLEKNDLKVPSVLLYPSPPAEGTMFLGDHTTPTVDGDFKLGPSAMPALSGRHFGTFGDFSLAEVYETMSLATKFLGHEDFGMYMKLLREQFSLLRKMNKIGKLAEFSDVQISKNFADQFKWSNGGIRHVVFDEDLKPLGDFLVKERDRGLHIINYNSPGWTAAFPMADYVTEKIQL